MNVYDVYRHPVSLKYQAVKQGFCWPAFFLLCIWAFARRLYILGIGLGSFAILMVVTELIIKPDGILSESLMSVFQAACYAGIAWFANDIRRWFLRIKGFEMQASLPAKWPSQAIRQYIDLNNSL